ncbi:MAG: MATE family efflux transporter [Firmicutes bacterium]|nr:MATE family efflux transporter [Bacillota bacterium]
MTENMSLTEGSISKSLIAFSLPILLGQIFQQLYNTADALIVGRFLSDEAYAAVSSSGSLVFLLIGFFSGIAVGAGVVISRYFGAKDDKMLETAIHTTVAFGIISGILLTVVGMTLTPQILKLMGTPDNVMKYSVEYFRMYFAGALAISMYNLLRSVLQAVGDSRHPLYYLIVSSLVNVGLDILFIAVFKWGVWSAALATTLSQFVSVFLCLLRLMRSEGACRLILKKIRADGPMMREIIHFGLPSGMQNSIISIANVVVQSNINAFGDIAMSGSGTYSKLEGFAFLPITCFSMAITTFVSQNLGAKQFERAKKGASFGIVCCVIIAELIGAGLIAFSEPLMALFTDNPASVAIGIDQARIECLFYCVLALSHCIAAVMRGAGRPMVPMLVMLGAWCVLRVSYITVAVKIFNDIKVVFSAYPLTWTVSAIVFLIFFFCSDWIHSYEKMEQNRTNL